MPGDQDARVAQHGPNYLARCSPCGHPPLQRPTRLPRLAPGPKRRALAAWVPKRGAAVLKCRPRVAQLELHCLCLPSRWRKVAKPEAGAPEVAQPSGGL